MSEKVYTFEQLDEAEFHASVEAMHKERNRILADFNRLAFNYSSRFQASEDYEMLVGFVGDVRKAIVYPPEPPKEEGR